MRTLLVWSLCASVLAGCANLMSKSPSGPEATPTGSTVPPSKPPVGPTGRPDVPVTPPGPPLPPVPPTLEQKRQAEEYARNAKTMLNDGNEALAVFELDQAQKLDPDNALAKTLRETLVPDAVEKLPKDYWKYKVIHGDTLSSLAGRFLKDVNKFYLLARYNGITVPKNLAVGRELKIPGTKPYPLPTPTTVQNSPTTSPSSTQVTEPSVTVDHCAEGTRLLKTGDKDKDRDKAYDYLLLCPNQAMTAQIDVLRRELVQTHSRRAREAGKRQDPSAELREWDRVLQLDPNNGTAKTARQEAINILEKTRPVR